MPTPQKLRTVLLGPVLDELVDRDESVKNFNQFVRRLIARHYRQPKLAEAVKMGRPKKS